MERISSAPLFFEDFCTRAIETHYQRMKSRLNAVITDLQARKNSLLDEYPEADTTTYDKLMAPLQNQLATLDGYKERALELLRRPVYPPHLYLIK